METNVILFIIIASAILYPIGMRLLAVSVQPTRLKMADLGSALLKSAALSADQKKIIASMLEDAFDWRFMAFAAVCVPVIVWRIVWKQPVPNPMAGVGGSTEKQLNKMISYYLRSAAAANPMFFVIAMVEFVVFAIPTVLLQKILGDESSMRRALRAIVVITESHSWHTENHVTPNP